jgi:hypothetical protein
MATSHFCNGKWRPGTVAACPKHRQLSRTQPSVYRRPDEGKGTEKSSGSSGNSES